METPRTHGLFARAPHRALGVLTALFFGAALSRTRLLVANNDFWDLAYLARIADVTCPETLRNGFFPLGYPLLLKSLAWAASPIVITHLFGLLAAAIFVPAFFRCCEDAEGRGVATWATVLLAVLPYFFAFPLAGGPDMPALALAFSGSALLLRVPAGSGKRAALGGLCLGAAGLIRYHAVVFGVCLLAALIVSGSLRRKPMAAAITAFLAGYLPQILVNLAAGAPAFAHSQAFNVYKLVHGVDWHHIDPASMPASVPAVILEDPGAFLRSYLLFMLPYGKYLLPLFIYPWLAPDRRRAFALSAACLAYFAIASLGGSPRGLLLILPFCVLYTAATAARAYAHLANRLPATSRRRLLVIPGLALIPILVFLGKDFRSMEAARERQGGYARLEHALAEGSPHLEAKQVFSTDFDFYLPRHPPYAPYVNGGWARLDLRGYNQAYPEIDTGSLEGFLSGCRARGIRFLVLDAGAGNLLAGLGDIYTGSRSNVNVTQVGEAGGMKAYRLAD